MLNKKKTCFGCSEYNNNFQSDFLYQAYRVDESDIRSANYAIDL